MIIGNRIKNARMKKGYSQAELGQKIGVSKVSVCGYELGSRTPSLDTLLQIANHLDLDPNHILGYDVPVISEDVKNYSIKLAKEDIEIIKQLKKHPVLYNKIASSPERTIQLISRKIKN